ncbi:MAG: hypothetical protein AAB692_05945 [Patescibacteria group bacterium]
MKKALRTHKALFTPKQMSGLALLAQVKIDKNDESLLDELVELITRNSPNRRLVQETSRRLRHWLHWLDANRQTMTETALLKTFLKRIKQSGKRYELSDSYAWGLINWASANKDERRSRILQPRGYP